jgi:arylsulfatase A-like enzyme
MDYKLVRTPRYKYVHWTHHPELHELYDLEEDPYEMRNVVREPRYDTVRAELQQRLGDLVVEALSLTE